MPIHLVRGRAAMMVVTGAELSQLVKVLGETQEGGFAGLFDGSLLIARVDDPELHRPALLDLIGVQIAAGLVTEEDLEDEDDDGEDDGEDDDGEDFGEAVEVPPEDDRGPNLLMLGRYGVGPLTLGLTPEAQARLDDEIRAVDAADAEKERVETGALDNAAPKADKDAEPPVP